MTLFQKIMKFLHDFFMPDAAPKTSTKVISSSIFSDINIDAIADELDIREKAMQDGKNEKPTSDRIDLGATEKEIAARMKKYMDDAASRVESQITNSSKDIQSKIDALTQRVANIKHKVAFEIESQKVAVMIDYEKEAREYYSNLREYNNFRSKHNITRDAKALISTPKFIGLAICIFVFEIFVNAFLFSENSEYGLVGAIFAIGIFSSCNIFLGILTGFALRNIHRPHALYKIFGCIASLSGVVIIIGLNLVLMHYRYLYEMSDHSIALHDAWQNAWSHSVPTDLYSLALCFLGITFSLFASYKAYLKDETIYGYGEIQRKLNKSKKQEKDKRDFIIEDLQEINQEITKEVEECRDEFKNISLRVNSSITWASRNDHEYKTYINKVNDSLAKLLKIYRHINKEHRSTTQPSYFTRPTMLEEYKIVDSRRIIENEVSEFNKKYNEALNEMKHSQQTIATTLSEAFAHIETIQAKYSGEVFSHE